MSPKPETLNRGYSQNEGGAGVQKGRGPSALHPLLAVQGCAYCVVGRAI